MIIKNYTKLIFDTLVTNTTETLNDIFPREIVNHISEYNKLPKKSMRAIISILIGGEEVYDNTDLNDEEYLELCNILTQYTINLSHHNIGNIIHNNGHNP